MYGRGCHICYSWSRLQLGFTVRAHRSTIRQINIMQRSHFTLTLCQRGLF